MLPLAYFPIKSPTRDKARELFLIILPFLILLSLRSFSSCVCVERIQRVLFVFRGEFESGERENLKRHSWRHSLDATARHHLRCHTLRNISAFASSPARPSSMQGAPGRRTTAPSPPMCTSNHFGNTFPFFSAF
ncbi:hypothetical protein U1Q18_023092 [Sarracenia purpurea var. burkii]